MARSQPEYEAGEAAWGGPMWPRIAGFRVVASWPEGGYARPPRAISPWAQLAGVFGVLLILAGTGAVGVVFLSQRHAPSRRVTDPRCGVRCRCPSISRPSA